MKLICKKRRLDLRRSLRGMFFHLAIYQSRLFCFLSLMHNPHSTIATEFLACQKIAGVLPPILLSCINALIYDQVSTPSQHQSPSQNIPILLPLYILTFRAPPWTNSKTSTGTTCSLRLHQLTIYGFRVTVAYILVSGELEISG